MKTKQKVRQSAASKRNTSILLCLFYNISTLEHIAEYDKTGLVVDTVAEMWLWVRTVFSYCDLLFDLVF